MEKQPDEKRGLFDDDDLDTAIANVDDTGIVKSQQVLVEEEQLQQLPGREAEGEDELP